ncbi:MAG: MarR family transcriptional regulator [Eubacteriaceae bacterium]|nr:MarR family transcriptional regulator [Eubacteriaceae bacterium]
MKLLSILWSNNDINAKELAELMEIRPPSLSDALDRAEKRGEITRVRDAKDLRVYRIRLTDLGRQQVSSRRSEYEKVQQEIESCLTQEEKQVFIGLCKKLSERLADLSEHSTEKISHIEEDN